MHVGKREIFCSSRARWFWVGPTGSWVSLVGPTFILWLTALAVSQKFPYGKFFAHSDLLTTLTLSVMSHRFEWAQPGGASHPRPHQHPTAHRARGEQTRWAKKFYIWRVLGLWGPLKVRWCLIGGDGVGFGPSHNDGTYNKGASATLIVRFFL